MRVALLESKASRSRSAGSCVCQRAGGEDRSVILAGEKMSPAWLPRGALEHDHKHRSARSGGTGEVEAGAAIGETIALIGALRSRVVT